jgi:transcriptional regulator with XRE-family HTH domain
MINPLKRIKKKHNWTIQDFAVVCDLSSSSVYKNLEGSNFEITDRILDTLGKMGYDPEKIKKEYAQFREEKRLEKMKK